MRLADSFILSFQNSVRGGIKSILCAAAVCTGICIVCIVSGLGDMLSLSVEKEIDSIGVGGILIYSDDQSNGYIEDNWLKQIKYGTEGLNEIMPFGIDFGTADVKNISYSAALCGVNESFDDVFGTKLLYGRYFTVSDILKREKVVILDAETAKNSYKRENIVGKSIRISCQEKSDIFKVIGVIEAQTSGLEMLVGVNLPSFFYIPHTSLIDMCNKNTVNKVVVSCFKNADPDKTASNIVKWLENREAGLSYKYEDLNSYTSKLSGIVDKVSVFANAVAAVSILTGGLGIINSMMLSVDNRINEIGIYMALGSRRRDIVLCFLLESVFICLAGGISGCLISYILFVLVRSILGVSILSLNIIFTSLLVSFLCGIIFGVVPAVKAAQMNPIDAIR